MNGHTVIVLISQGCGIVGRIVILISGHYLKGVWLSTGQHKSRKVAHYFGLGRNHHSWNRQWNLILTGGLFRAQRSLQSVSPRELGPTQFLGINTTIKRMRKRKKKRFIQMNWGTHFHKFPTIAVLNKIRKGLRKQNWEFHSAYTAPLGTCKWGRPQK